MSTWVELKNAGVNEQNRVCSLALFSACLEHTGYIVCAHVCGVDGSAPQIRDRGCLSRVIMGGGTCCRYDKPSAVSILRGGRVNVCYLIPLHFSKIQMKMRPVS